jgi:hypothetical protein
MTNCIAPITYAIGAATATYDLPTYTVTPNCGGKPVSYALQMVSGGSVPNAFSIDSTNKKFVITQNVPIANGVYDLRIIATETWSATSPKTESSCTFTVTVTCTQSIALLTNVIPATYTYYLNPNTLATVSWATPTYGPVPSSCSYGPVTYTVKNVATGTCPTWITCSPVAGSSISIGTTDTALVGTYNF